ncbi:MAG: hypothetical protein AAF211_00435 [Myxococcota bacterium]
MRHALLCVLASCLLLLNGCAKDGPDTGDDVLIPDSTRVVDDAVLDAVTSVSADLSEIVLPVGAADWSADDVLVSGVHPMLPYGMLRRVTEVEELGDGTVRVRTSSASLAEAIERGSFDAEFELDASMIVDRQQKVPIVAPPASGFFFGYDDLELFDADGDPETRDDRVSLDGSFSFRPSLGLQVAFDGFALETLSFELRADQESSLRLEAGREAVFEKAFVVEEIELTPIVFSIGPVPVVLVPRILLVVGVDGRVTAELLAGVAASSRPRLGFGYQDGSWGVVTELEPMAQFDAPSFRVGAAGEARVWAGPRAELAAYGVAGAFGELRAFAKADLDSRRDPWWELYAGLEARGGFFVEVFDVTLVDYEFDPVEVETLLADAGEPAPLAGAQVAPWSRTWAGERTDHPNQVFETSEGGLMMLGRSNSFTSGGDDAWLMKLDRLGQVSWQVAFDGLYGALNGYQRPDGDFVVAMGLTGSGTDRAYLVRLDPNGEPRWAEQLVHAEDNVAIKAVAPVGDDVFAVGVIGSGPSQDFWAARLDAAGEVVWAERVGGPSDDVPTALLADGDEFVAVGSTRSFGGTNISAWAVGLSADGEVLWQRTYEQVTGGNEVLTGVIPAPGGYRLTGHIFGEALLLEVGPTGVLDRASLFESGSNYHQIVSSAETADGGALLAGVTGIGDASDTWLLRLTPDSTVLWSTAFGGSFGEEAGGITSAANLAEAVVVTDDDGVVVASNVQRDETSWDAWLMKVSGTGVISFDDPDYDADALSGSFVEIGVDDQATDAVAEPLVFVIEDIDVEAVIPEPDEAVQALPSP